MANLRLNNQLIKAKLLETGKFSSVRFSKAPKINNKWNVYLRPKSMSKGVHFRISYVNGGLVSQDEIIPDHRQYYEDSRTIRLLPVKTPLGTIDEVCNRLNDGCYIIKL